MAVFVGKTNRSADSDTRNSVSEFVVVFAVKQTFTFCTPDAKPCDLMPATLADDDIPLANEPIPEATAVTPIPTAPWFTACEVMPYANPYCPEAVLASPPAKANDPLAVFCSPLTRHE
jgi:hypothetical protein